MTLATRTVADGNLSTYVDRLDLITRHMERAAPVFGVEVEFGSSRLTGSRGVFSRRYITNLKFTVRGNERRDVRGYCDFVRTLTQDATR